MVGIRYQYGGSSPKGFDCSGLVWYSHKQAGISIPRTAREQMKRSNPINRNNMRSGDLLFFKTGWGSNYHVATYVGGGLFIHAPSSGKKVSITRLDTPYWKQRLKRVGTFYPVR
jgi:cell wall-associated NlpC family hydrolase